MSVGSTFSTVTVKVLVSAPPSSSVTVTVTVADADGRVIGTGVFPPAQYLGENPGAALLEPGQSARIAFRVQEPAASTVAFTFEFQ